MAQTALVELGVLGSENRSECAVLYHWGNAEHQPQDLLAVGVFGDCPEGSMLLHPLATKLLRQTIARPHPGKSKTSKKSTDLALWFFGDDLQPFYCSRMMVHGQEDTTEIIGTEGKLTVNGNPQANLVNIYSPAGITREIPAHYYGRFEHAFVQEANEFADA